MKDFYTSDVKPYIYTQIITRFIFKKKLLNCVDSGLLFFVIFKKPKAEAGLLIETTQWFKQNVYRRTRLTEISTNKRGNTDARESIACIISIGRVNSLSSRDLHFNIELVLIAGYSCTVDRNFENWHTLRHKRSYCAYGIMLYDACRLPMSALRTNNKNRKK